MIRVADSVVHEKYSCREYILIESASNHESSECRMDGVRVFNFVYMH